MTTGRELEINLSTLLGLNNRRPDFRLRTKEGSFLRAASNAVISNAGTAKRRAGYTKKIAGSDCHSFWVDRTGVGFYVDETTLYRVTAAGEGLARLALSTDLVRGRMLTYARVGTDIVFSDGVTNRCIGSDGERPFGVPELQVQPTATASTGGALPAGVYQVCFAFANEQLELSGTTVAQMVEVFAGGKLAVTGLPTTWPRGVDTLIVYVSQPNAQIMFAELSIRVPTGAVTLSVLAGSGEQATTYLQRALPPGRILRYFGTRLLVADGPLLWYSNVYSPALCSPSRSSVQFPAPITVIEPCDNGVFLVADQTYWLEGDIESTTLKVVSPGTAVFGTGGQMPHTQQCFWIGSKGLVIGDVGGQISLPQDENVAVNSAIAGASTVVEFDGQRHAVSTLFGVDNAPTAARSYMDAEVIRKGTSL